MRNLRSRGLPLEAQFQYAQLRLRLEQTVVHELAAFEALLLRRHQEQSRRSAVPQLPDFLMQKRTGWSDKLPPAVEAQQLELNRLMGRSRTEALLHRQALAFGGNEAAWVSHQESTARLIEEAIHAAHKAAADLGLELRGVKNRTTGLIDFYVRESQR